MRHVAVAIALVAALAGPVGAEDKPYELRTTAPAAPPVVGRKTSVSVTIVPRAGLRIMDDAPLYIRVAAAPGLKLARRKLRRANAVDPRAELPRFEIVFVPERPGRFAVTGTAVFYLCDERTCRNVRETVRWTVEANSPAPGP